MDKNYHGKNISMKLSNDISGIVATFDEFNKLLAENLKKQFVINKDSLGKKMLQEMKRIVKRGGSEINKYTWTYWTRKKGESNWKSKKPSTSKRTFSWGVTSYRGSNTVMNYPVHPATYFGDLYFSRGNRRYPRKGEFAMTDYGRLTKTLVTFNPTSNTNLSVKFYSANDRDNEKILKNEKGWIVPNSGLVRRPIVQPAFDKVEPLIEGYFDKASRATDRDINKLFKSLKRVKK